MTIIVGVVTTSHSFIAADTLAFESNQRFKAQDKIICKGKLLMGAAGSYAIINCLQHWFTPPRKHKNYTDEDYMFKQVYLSIRNTLVKFDLICSSSGKQEIDGSILIVYEGKIYIIQEDFSMLCIKNNFYVIGSGAEYTTATYKTLELYKSGSVVPDRIREAAKIASAFCPSINCDMTILNYRNGVL